MYESLRYIRKKRKVSCEKMSEVIGLCTRSGYHKKETGAVPFSLEEAKKISDYFDKPIEDIFFTDDVSFKGTTNEDP